MILPEPVYLKKQKALAAVWGITFLILFPFMAILGLLMRLGQGEFIKLLLANFYAIMTLHGLGMAALLFSMAFAATWYLIGTRFVKLNTRIGYFVFFTELLGFILLTVGTLIGKFGAGWNLLYPLAFKDPTWASWSIVTSIISILIFVIGWLTGISHLLFSLTKEYHGFSNLLGWQYLRKGNEKEEKKELPPLVFITTISLIQGMLGFFVGIILMAMYLFQFFKSALVFDPLILKNMVFFYLYSLVNITLYLSLGWVYALLPEFTGRLWKTNKILVYSWNATLFLMLLAFFYQSYLDVSQPLSVQNPRQILFYLATIPAAIITILGVSTQLYYSKIKWGIIPLMFLLGLGGCAIGGFIALMNSSAAVNKVLQNTLWGTAYFHTYTLMGIVLFIFGFLFYLFPSKKERQGNKMAMRGFWIFVTGGYGFLLMFYLGGLSGIPHSYARYTGMGIKSMHTKAVFFSQLSVGFIILLLIGLFIMYLGFLAKFRRGRDDFNL